VATLSIFLGLSLSEIEYCAARDPIDRLNSRYGVSSVARINFPGNVKSFMSVNEGSFHISVGSKDEFVSYLPE
jgi:hypothetical protein